MMRWFLFLIHMHFLSLCPINKPIGAPLPECDGLDLQLTFKMKCNWRWSYLNEFGLPLEAKQNHFNFYECSLSSFGVFWIFLLLRSCSNTELGTDIFRMSRNNVKMKRGFCGFFQGKQHLGVGESTASRPLIGQLSPFLSSHWLQLSTRRPLDLTRRDALWHFNLLFQPQKVKGER